MNGGRHRRRSHLKPTEVNAMTPTGHTPGQDTSRSTAEIERRLDVAGRQKQVIHALDVCGARLPDVQQAKVAPEGLTAAELRAASDFRRQVLRGEPA